jgi:putative phosphoribosyl transferase
MKFAGIDDAAEHLAARLEALGLPRTKVVLAVGHDSLPLAQRVGARLGAARIEAPPVELLALPWYPRLAFGALTADNHHYIDAVVTADHSLGAREIAQLCRERLGALRGGGGGWRRPRPVGEVDVVLVSRGLSTGYRALALAASARAGGAAEVLVAAPCGARDAVARLAPAARAVVLHVSDAPRFDPDDCWQPPAASEADAHDPPDSHRPPRAR